MDTSDSVVPTFTPQQLEFLASDAIAEIIPTVSLDEVWERRKGTLFPPRAFSQHLSSSSL